LPLLPPDLPAGDYLSLKNPFLPVKLLIQVSRCFPIIDIMISPQVALKKLLLLQKHKIKKKKD